ncbi:MAG: glycosyltransferase family 4 protein [Clostridia bacterium]|nr:glycosyltransferase family 4 protein [Clostridia bacterium]
MKKILLLPSLNLPIPAIGGGAVEQLLTFLLETNEQYGKVRFVVVSKLDEKARTIKYKHSKIYYFDTNNDRSPELPLFRTAWTFYRFFCKVFYNRISTKIFKPKRLPMGINEFFSYCVAKNEKIDIVILEGRYETPYDFFNDMVGSENLYHHIHGERTEDLAVRKTINNSISISTFVKNSWVINKTIPGKNIVLPNCADVEKFDVQLDTDARNKARSELGVSADELLILYCGRIIPEKGIRELLDAMEELRDKPIKLLMIGSSGFSLKTKTDFETEIANQIKSNPAIIQLGYIPNNELPTWFSLCDVQVIPTTCQEGAGIVAIEGMSAGLPLITTISGGMVEYVNDEVAIQLPIDENLSQNIVRAVLKLYHSPEMRREMSNAGKENSHKYSKEDYYKNFIQLF